MVAEKKKGGLEDEDLEALVSDTAYALDDHWQLEGLQVTTGMSGIPTATVTLVGPDGVGRFVSATGDGPVDAVYKAIDKLIGVKLNLETCVEGRGGFEHSTRNARRRRGGQRGSGGHLAPPTHLTTVHP